MADLFTDSVRFTLGVFFGLTAPIMLLAGIGPLAFVLTCAALYLLAPTRHSKKGKDADG